MNRTYRLVPFALACLALACGDSKASCPEENAVCGTICVDTRIDPNHCGGCDVACGAGFVCKDSACVCPANETPCSNGCVDTATDPSNCGGCGLACAAAEVCQDGQCIPCTGEGCSCETCGGETCVDLRGDEANCGACGHACPSGTSCLNGACAVGDLYVACMGAGTVRPFLRADLSPGAPDASGIGGPQSLALLPPNHLLVAGGMDDRLWVFDRATMASAGFAELGASSVANQVLVREGRAYAIESGTNTVQVVDLSDPAAPALLAEVTTGEGTNPYGAAFADDGTLWVSLWLPGQVVAIPFGAEAPEAGTPIDIPTEGLEGSPYPAGVAVRGTTVYVTLNNLGADFKPAGNGRLAILDGEAGIPAGAPVDLGDGCRNPGFPAFSGTDLWIPCGGTLDENWASNQDGALVRFDTLANAVAETVPTGGSPGRLSVLPDGTVYASNSGGSGFLVVAPDGGQQSVEACPAGGFEFVADVLAVP